MTIKLRGLIAPALVLAAVTARAETAYVTDILQLALHEQEGSSGSLLRNLVSGTQLEVLERKNYYARVRTADGVEGWTKANFLVADKPARLRLAELEQQSGALATDRDKALESLAAERERLAAVREQAQKASQLANENAAKLRQLQQENADYRSRLSVQEFSIPWKWSLGGLLASLILGFMGGIFWFDYRSRRRHGGHRIY
ncbi:MAG: TIGR04211 family SH3 domain-containing protein [Gammaproteobacteria bacterium]|nr:TIGR04211 family SH3 domain-containing protein [Gammaproteobacteria bacterium]